MAVREREKERERERERERESEREKERKRKREREREKERKREREGVRHRRTQACTQEDTWTAEGTILKRHGMSARYTPHCSASTWPPTYVSLSSRWP
jgi:hypothetical protein